MIITAKEIHDKALSLGYVACGIVKSEAMHTYEEMIDKRIERFPMTKPFNSYLNKFSKPEEAWPSGKSIIVCAGRYGKYNIPDELQGRIGKYYLTDYRVVPESKEYQAARLFDEYLTENGVQFQKDTLSGGISACRYAAAKAGIGIIRKNNFLYTEYGSWVWLETWLIDRDLEYICETNIPPCPEGCTKCVEACETGALTEFYRTNAFFCTSLLSWGGPPNALPPEALRMKMKNWLYGCDDCQDCCPMNKGCWSSEENFPGMDEMTKYLTLEQLCVLDDETLTSKLSPLFFYIGHDKIWKWRVNALRAMVYQYRPGYLPYIQQAAANTNELVREMAKWAPAQIRELSPEN